MPRTGTAKTSFIAEPGKQEIVMVREFDAPRERVFRAFTDPEAIPQWWGPARLATTVDRMEAKEGGVWRFVQRDSDGNEYAFHGVYHEVTAPERIVYTFEFEGMPGHVTLDAAVFEEVGAKTRVTAKSVFQSLEGRDGMVQAGAEEGAVEGWERLAALVEGA